MLWMSLKPLSILWSWHIKHYISSINKHQHFDEECLFHFQKFTVLCKKNNFMIPLSLKESLTILKIHASSQVVKNKRLSIRFVLKLYNKTISSPLPVSLTCILCIDYMCRFIHVCSLWEKETIHSISHRVLC